MFPSFPIKAAADTEHPNKHAGTLRPSPYIHKILNKQKKVEELQLVGAKQL